MMRERNRAIAFRVALHRGFSEEWLDVERSDTSVAKWSHVAFQQGAACLISEQIKCQDGRIRHGPRN